MNNTQNEKAIIYGAYARKSSESEDRQVQSIETQTDQLLKMIKEHSLNLYGSALQESQSAFSPGREAFNNLVALTFNGTLNAWLCYHPNRLSRNPVDGGIIIHLMDIGHLDHIRTPNKIYRNNPTDKMMLQFEFMMSKKDSDDKSVFVKDGLEKRYKKGFPTGKAPMGFLNDKSKEKGDRDWIVDEERFEKTTLILRRFLKGNDSLNTLTDFAREELLLRTVKGKRIGGALVSRSGIERILKNPIYAGFFYSKDSKSNSRTKRKLDSKLPRIISLQEHQRILAMLSEKSKTKKQQHDPTYTGIIKAPNNGFIGADLKFQLICDCKYKFAYRSKNHCPKCGQKITALKHPKYLNYIYYYNVQRTKKKLGAKRIEESKVEKFLFTYLKEDIFIQQELIDWAKRHLKILKLQELDQLKLKQASKEKELAILQKKLKKLKDLYYNDAISIVEFKKEQNHIQNEIDLVGSKVYKSRKISPSLTEFLSFASSVDTIAQFGTKEDKRRIFKYLGSNLIWDEEKLIFIKPKWLLAYENVRKNTIAKFDKLEPAKNIKFKGSNNYNEGLCPTLLRGWSNVRTLHQQWMDSKNSF